MVPFNTSLNHFTSSLISHSTHDHHYILQNTWGMNVFTLMSTLTIPYVKANNIFFISLHLLEKDLFFPSGLSPFRKVISSQVVFHPIHGCACFLQAVNTIWKKQYSCSFLGFNGEDIHEYRIKFYLKSFIMLYFRGFLQMIRITTIHIFVCGVSRYRHFPRF